MADSFQTIIDRINQSVAQRDLKQIGAQPSGQQYCTNSLGAGATIIEDDETLAEEAPEEQSPPQETEAERNERIWKTIQQVGKG